MTFAHPQALWLLALLPVIWLFAHRGRHGRTPRRLVGAALLRSATVALLVVAIAQPRVPERSRAVSVVYALDISRSVAPAFLDRSLAWIRATNAHFKPAQARYLVFADRARLLASLEDVAAVAVSSTNRPGGAQTIAQDATDIEQALGAALPGFGPGEERRLVLISDGIQTHGDVWRMLPRLQSGRVRVYAVPAAVARARDAWVETIVVPTGVRAQDPFTLRVNVHALGPMSARVRLTSGSQRLGEESVTLHAGVNEVAFEATLPDAGLRPLTATVRAQGDRFDDNDTLVDSIQVGPRPRVLYVEGIPESAHHLADALRAHHLDVAIAGPEVFAARASSLGSFDAVILSDLYVQTIDAKSQAALEVFVRDQGGGLIFAAGESTYGEAGYVGSALERLLPVRFEGKRKRRELDLVLLIDRSHSMRGRKLEQAKTAALSTLDLLEARHRLAVVAFDARAHEVVPLAAVGNKRRAEDLIASMTARGQTNILPALVEAQRLLAGSTATTRHVILLSDGVTVQPPGPGSDAPNAAQIQALIQRGRDEALRRDGIAIPPPEAAVPVAHPGAIETLVANLARAGITVSTVAIGDKPDLALMGDIAALGRGRGYVARSDAEIPSLFVTETRRLLGASMVEESFRPTRRHRVAALAGIDFASGPPLRGLVVARAKSFAEVLLTGPGDRPLLVTTHFGLGKTVAFLSDVKNRWSSEWIGWDGYGRFWAQLVRATMPRPDAGNLTLRVTRTGGEAMVELRALDRGHGYRNGLAPAIRLVDPSGRATTLMLRQVAPGHYAAHRALEVGHAQPYRFELIEGGGLTRADVRDAGSRSLGYGWSDEYRALPPDTALLRSLSELTGGAYEPKAADIFALHGDGEATPRPLWPYLIAGALGLFLLDILWRRAPWTVSPRRWRSAPMITGGDRDRSPHMRMDPGETSVPGATGHAVERTLGRRA
ncbi:MAG: VWA domain-containing protein [Betaproteobacteria bacterium]